MNNQRGFALIVVVLIVVVIIFVSVAGYFILVKKSENIIREPPSTYSTEPFTECVKCKDGETWDNKPCCPANFEKECVSKNGVVRWSDLHPAFPSIMKGCFQKAPDTGKECASGNDCLSGVCDLESAIKSNKCTLIKKELTGEGVPGREFYTAFYSCDTPKPGACTETISNRINPGGVSHTFEMDNKTLIETLEPGLIF